MRRTRLRRLIQWLALGICLFLGIAYYFWYEDQSNPELSGRYDLQAAQVSVDIDRLFQDYQVDLAAANKEYRGKVIDLYGTVASVTPSGGAMTALLKSSDGQSSVVCNFQLDRVTDFASLKLDQEVTVHGLFVDGGANVGTMKGCSVHH
jgi:hypothetical protein